MSLFQKLRTLTLGTAHDLLDKAIDLNSPTMIRQYVRDLEDAIGKLQSETAIQQGQLTTMKREKTQLETKINTDTETVKKYLVTDKESLKARSLAAVIVTEKKQLETINLDTQAKVVEELTNTVTALQGKHDLMVARVRELERLDRDTKTKESAAKAITNAGSILNTVGSKSVDDLQDRMQRRNDVANAKFDSSMGTIQDDGNKEEVDALLASLK